MVANVTMAASPATSAIRPRVAASSGGSSKWISTFQRPSAPANAATAFSALSSRSDRTSASRLAVASSQTRRARVVFPLKFMA
jgi:hypothetical protein